MLNTYRITQLYAVHLSQHATAEQQQEHLACDKSYITQNICSASHVHQRHQAD